MTPHELLGAARDLMRRPGACLDGIWPRAAALLAWQALEAAMATCGPPTARPPACPPPPCGPRSCA